MIRSLQNSTTIPFPTPFERRLSTAFPLDRWRERRVCLAVSGGADSVALLRGFVRIATATDPSRLGDLFVVSVDHRSRGAESDGDVAFVRDLSERLGVRFVKRTVDSDALRAEARRVGSWESAARTERYRLLVDSAKRGGARYLATAHNRDDRLETLLFRLFRGAGLDGLRGIPAVRPLDDALVLIRPALEISRAEILDYLEKLGQPFRFDSSNASPKYARNRIRRELVPLLESLFPGRWADALTRFSELATETENFFDAATRELDGELADAERRNAAFRRALAALNVPDDAQNARSDADAVVLPLEPLRAAPPEIVVRYFRRLWRERNWPLGQMGAAEWNRLTAVARAPEPPKNPPRQFPGNVFATFPDAETLRLERR